MPIFFATPLPAEKKLPILNKPPDPVETQKDSSSDDGQYNQDGASTSSQSNASKNAQNGQKFEKTSSTATIESYIQFQCFAHLAISVKSVGELCADASSNGVEIHIFFEEDFPRLPRIGFSCLSLQELYEDRVLLHDESATPDQLSFIQLVRLVDAGLKEISSWMVVAPKRGQTLSISLDLADGTGVRVRLSFESMRSTPWYSVRFPPHKSDFSLVIDVAKKEVLRRSYEESSLSIMSTYGWLERKLKTCLHKRGWSAEENEAQWENGEQRAEMNIGLNAELVKGECMLCFEPNSDTLFYPCCHLNVHRKCLPKEKEEMCYACREKCEELISIRQRGLECQFCQPSDECREFNSFFYPCGCSIGCMDGFKMVSREMGISCSACGNVIQNVLKIFISNAAA